MCKIEMRWSMARMRPYVAGVTRVSKGFIPQIALSPVTAADDKGLRLVEVYMKRRPPQKPGEAAPGHAH
jgi:hypothetical protein